MAVRGYSSTKRSLPLWQRVIDALPRGSSQTEAEWARSHRAILRLLVAHAVGLFAFGLVRGYDVPHVVLEAAVPLAAAAIASTASSRRTKALAASFGLVLCSSILVHFSGGAIEAHFHFFVVLPIIALYQDWTPFLVAIGYVVIEHGLTGALVPRAVYNHPAAIARPWTWAAIHGAFVLAESAAVIVAWRLAEQGQLKAAAASQRLIEHQAEALEQHERNERERKAAEQEQSLLAALVNSHSDGIWSATLDQVVTSWNPGAERMFGYSAEEMKGQPLSILLPDEKDDMGYVLEDVLRGESRDQLERLRKTRSGDLIDVALTIAPIFDRDGNVTGFSTVCRDIRHRKNNEMQRALLEGRVRQSQKMEAVGQLAGGIAHDFNNLLAVILNYTGFVAEELPPGDQRRDDLEEVIRAAERGSNLTRQLLTFSRKDVARVSRVILNDVLEGMRKLFDRTLRENIDVTIDPAPDLLPVNVDVSRIEQILMNLAVNARDAMEHGGRFDITTSNVMVTPDVMEVHPGLRQGAYVRLTVSDTGTGMTPEVQARAFEPFFTTKEVGHGTGLGLATTYAIVTDAGGDITLYSEPGKGVTFSIYLPAAEAGEAEEEAIVLDPAAGGRGETVLVIEDSAPVRKLAHRILSRHGYRVVTATNGEEAIALADETEVDVVLSDVVMPGMSAEDLEAQLDKPMVFMSGYTERIVTQHGFLHDTEGFLQKPFTAEQLLTTVRSVLDRSNGGADSTEP